MIPLASPKENWDAHQAAIRQAMDDVVSSGNYILGPQTHAFEEEFAAFLETEHVIGVSSGTDALVLALRALGIGSGDEVITVAHTAVATLAAIRICGATPVLVDIDPVHFTMDPRQLPAALTQMTRAIIPVHLYGQPCDMDAIMAFAREHGLRVIEDCAQAAGARWRGRRVGTIGDLGTFSFYPTKNLGAIGDAGAIVTEDPGLAEKCRLLRQYGWSADRLSRLDGFNARIDEMQAAILRVKLAALEQENERRRAISARYLQACGRGIEGPEPRDGVTHVYHLFVVQTDAREEAQRAFAEASIGTGIHYPVPAHRQPAFMTSRVPGGALPNTDAACERILSLPMYPELTGPQVEQVCAALEALSSFAS